MAQESSQPLPSAEEKEMQVAANDDSSSTMTEDARAEAKEAGQSKEVNEINPPDMNEADLEAVRFTLTFNYILETLPNTNHLSPGHSHNQNPNSQINNEQ